MKETIVCLACMPDIQPAAVRKFLIENERPSEAEPLALRLLEGGPAAKERAKGMLRHIRAAQVGRQSAVQDGPLTRPLLRST